MADRPAGPTAPAAGLLDGLRDDTEVCACAGVTAGRIRGCAALDQARTTTRATTGCGGCADAVRSLIGTATLEGVTR